MSLPDKTSSSTTYAPGTYVDRAQEEFSKCHRVVYQTYLDDVGVMSVVPFKDRAIEPIGNITVRMLKISRIVYDQRENSLESLLNVFAAMGSDHALALILRSDKKGCDLYLGVRAYGSKIDAATGIGVLGQSLRGNFQGSDFGKDPQGIKYPDIEKLLSSSAEFTKKNDNWCVSASVCIPSLKNDDRKAFTQGLERLIDAMEGREYMAIILAEPVKQADIYQIKSGLEGMATFLSPYRKIQMSLSTNESKSLSNNISVGVSQSITDSISKSQSRTVGYTESISKSQSRTVGSSKSSSHTSGGSGGILFASASHSYSRSTSENESSTLGKTDTKGRNESDTSGQTDTKGTTEQKSINQTTGDSVTTGTGSVSTVDFQLFAVDKLIDKIEKNLERLDDIQAYGAWQSGAYFIADNTDTARMAATIYQGILKGGESSVGNSSIILWDDPEKKDRILENLCQLTIPALRFEGDDVNFYPASILSGKEMALMMNFPRHSVGGLTVIDGVSYGREKYVLGFKNSSDRKIEVKLGDVMHLHEKKTTRIDLNADDFVRHVLVSGTTGTGKTTAIKYMLRQLHKNSVPFLVIEPAKNEYKSLIHMPNVHFYQAGRDGHDCLRLNPFIFPYQEDKINQERRITVIEHIDRLCSLFNAAFPMYAAMPQVLENAIVNAYERSGWDIRSSRYVGSKPRFPTITDVADEIEGIVNSAGYSGEAKSTYIGALKTRLNSLMRGSLGLTFSAELGEETSPEELFDQSCVVNVSSIGSPEKRAVLMGLLLIRLQEHRIIQGERPSLKHLIVLEEAHNLLKPTSDTGNAEVANPRGQAIEYFSNAIAEMRSYGQGFLIADQSVSAIDVSVQRNTNTKIAFCAPFEKDREVIGGAMSLDEAQRDGLAKLDLYTAVVKQNNWMNAVLCKIDSPEEEDNKEYPSKNRGVKENDDIAAQRFCLMLVIENQFGKNYCRLSEEEVNLAKKWVHKHRTDSEWIKIWDDILLNKEKLTNERMVQAVYNLPECNRIIRQSFNTVSTSDGFCHALWFGFNEFIGGTILNNTVIFNSILTPLKGKFEDCKREKYSSIAESIAEFMVRPSYQKDVV